MGKIDGNVNSGSMESLLGMSSGLHKEAYLMVSRCPLCQSSSRGERIMY